MQAELEKELAEAEADDNKTGDATMEGTEEAQVKVKDEDEESNAGSEDLEEESSDEDDDEEEGEGEGEEDVEMGEDQEKPTQANGGNKQPEVMVH